jgi:hypothetical protein
MFMINKPLPFLESPESWNVYENKHVILESWNVVDGQGRYLKSRDRIFGYVIDGMGFNRTKSGM